MSFSFNGGSVLSADPENSPDVLGIVAASAALTISSAPFAGPVGAVRVGRVDGRFVLNPTYEQRETADLDLVVAGTREGVLMVEATANEVADEVMKADGSLDIEKAKPLW